MAHVNVAQIADRFASACSRFDPTMHAAFPFFDQIVVVLALVRRASSPVEMMRSVSSTLRAALSDD